MKYTVRTSVVDVLGTLWMPMCPAATSYTLTDHDVDNARDENGKITRESVQLTIARCRSQPSGGWTRTRVTSHPLPTGRRRSKTGMTPWKSPGPAKTTSSHGVISCARMRSEMEHYYITTAEGTRMWHADDADHAREQHEDAFPDEPILDIARDRHGHALSCTWDHDQDEECPVVTEDRTW